MNKKTESVNNAEEVEEVVVEEKVLVFNPTGFIAKVVLSIVLSIAILTIGWTDEGILLRIFSAVASFAVMYSVASLFGFVLRLSGNYIIAIILFFAALFGLGYLGSSLNEPFNTIFNIALLVLMAAVLANDIRKAILYFKYTV